MLRSYEGYARWQKPEKETCGPEPSPLWAHWIQQEMLSLLPVLTVKNLAGQDGWQGESRCPVEQARKCELQWPPRWVTVTYLGWLWRIQTLKKLSKQAETLDCPTLDWHTYPRTKWNIGAMLISYMVTASYWGEFYTKGDFCLLRHGPTSWVKHHRSK